MVFAKQPKRTLRTIIRELVDRTNTDTARIRVLEQEKDIVKSRFTYNIDAYRYIAKNGIPKIRLYSLVRYDREDVERKPAAILPVGVSKKSVLEWVEKQLRQDGGT